MRLETQKETALRSSDKSLSRSELVPFLEGVPIPSHMRGNFCFPGDVPDSLVIELGVHLMGDRFFDYLLFVAADSPPYEEQKGQPPFFDPVSNISDQVFEMALRARRPEWVLLHLGSFRPGAVDEERLVEALFATDEEMHTASGLKALAVFFPHLRSQDPDSLVERILQVRNEHAEGVEVPLLRNGYGKVTFENRRSWEGFDWRRLADAAVSYGFTSLLVDNLAYCRGLSLKVAGELFVKGHGKQVYSNKTSFENVDEVKLICAGMGHLVFPPDF